MREDIPSFFGVFLVKGGLISQEALDEALRLLDSSNKPLGLLANEMSLLDEDQASAILHEQSHSGKPFGLIARERGLLSDSQLKKLLDKQVRTHLFLGQALVELGHLTSARLMSALRDYWRLQQAINRHNSNLLAWAEDSSCLIMIMDALESAFRRYPRLPVKLGKLCRQASEVAYDHGFLMSLDLISGKRVSFWLGLPEKVTMTLHTMPQDMSAEESGALVVDAIWQLMDVIRRYLRAKISSAGHLVLETRSRYYATGTRPDALDDFLLVRLETPLAPCLLGYQVCCQNSLISQESISAREY